MISCVPASSENSFAQFLHLQYASYPFFVHVGACAAWYKMSWFLESFSPYSIPQVVQTAFAVQVAVPPVCLQIYPHSLQTPSFHSCASSTTVTRLQQLHFFLCVFAVWTHFSASVCLQLYPHTLHFPFSQSCKAQLSCACGSSFTGHASSVHWCQWYVSLFDQASVCECSWHFTFFSCSELSAYLPFFIAFHCSVVPR